MICTRCGTHIDDGETVCYKCGYVFMENVQKQNNMNGAQGMSFNQQPMDYNAPAQNMNYNVPEQNMGYNPAVQQNQGYNPQNNGYAQNQGYNSMGYGQDENFIIQQFIKEAKSMQTTGIVGAIFLLGFIGIGCSISIWVKRSKVKIPQVNINDPMLMQMFEKAKKQYNTAYILSFVPVVGFVLSFIIGFVSGM